MIEGVQNRFPDFRFRQIGAADGFGDYVRLSWGLGPDAGDAPIKGTDFGLVESRPPEGRDRLLRPAAGLSRGQPDRTAFPRQPGGGRVACRPGPPTMAHAMLLSPRSP